MALSMSLKLSCRQCVVCGKKSGRCPILQDVTIVRELLLKFCKINVVEGSICFNCVRQLENIDEKIKCLQRKASRTVVFLQSLKRQQTSVQEQSRKKINLGFSGSSSSMVSSVQVKSEKNINLGFSCSCSSLSMVSSVQVKSEKNINLDFLGSSAPMAFQELQSKMISTHQQLKVIEMQSEQMRRQIQYSKLVQQELSTLPENTRTYEGIGKMFLLQPIATIMEGLDEKTKTLEKKIELAQNNKTYLEKSLQESESNLRELVSSKQMESRAS